MRRLFLVVVAIVAMACSSCAVSKSDPAPSVSSTTADSTLSYQFPTALGTVTSRWQSVSGLNLVSREATVVRAFFESSAIAARLDNEAAFPGFSRLMTDAPGSAKIIEGESWDRPFAGTRRFLLQSISVTGDTLRSTVCDDGGGVYYSNRLTRKPSNPSASTPELSPGGFHRMTPTLTWYVVLRGPDHALKWPKRVDVGTSRAPNWDVFDGWNLKDYGIGNDAGYCDRWAMENYPGVSDPAVPNERFYPPEGPGPATQPTLPQYPGWTRIGEP